MVKRKLKINWFDGFIAAVILLTCLIVVFALNGKPYLGEKTVLVKVEISDKDMIKRVLPELASAGDVYFSGTKYPVKQVSYETKVGEDGTIEKLYVNLSGLGQIKEGDSIFNGQRIYLNEKVEIRDDYFIQGYVVDYKYE